MKKQLLILFLCASASSFAQVRVGVLAGGNLMTQKFSEAPKGAEFSSILAYHAGVLFSVPITESIFLQPGVNYQLKGNEISTTATNTKLVTKFHYLELPVNISFAVDAGGLKFAPYLGLYGAYAISGNSSFTASGATVTKEVEFSGNDQKAERMDYGGQVGVSLETGKLFFRLQYSLGLANIVKGNDDLTVKNRGFGLSIGYWINGSKK